MEKKARIDSLHEKGISFEIGSKEILIGRSKDCSIYIPEQDVSRHQAKIYLENNYHVIENLGRNPIFINGKQVEKHFLRDGDHLSIGGWEYVFHVEDSKPVFQEPTFEEKTVVLTTPMYKESLPRVVIISPDGQSKSYDINKDIFFIGRSPEADIRLDDPAISRKHCVIEKGKEGYFIKNLSEANPLIFNKKPVEKKRFFSGDQIKMGSYALTFLSDRPEDLQPKSKGIHFSIWLAVACLLIALTTFILYYQVYGPWKARKTLKTVSAYIDEGYYGEAHETLTRLLDTNPPQKESQKAHELLSHVTLLLAQAMVSDEKLSDAKKFLVTYLSKYGLDEESRDAWDLLDQCRIKLGQQLEDSRKYTEALKEFSAIREDSPYFDETQQTISRLWLINQQHHFQRQTVSQLLKEAEEHFQAQRYLTPVNKNAYAAYQAVLSFEPMNAVARRRIEKIKDFYRLRGENYFQKNNYTRAISFFEKYMLIDPQDISIKEKVVECRQKLAEMSKPEKEENAQRENVRRLLEESGSESSWIMKYLFEEGQQKDTETPW